MGQDLPLVGVSHRLTPTSGPEARRTSTLQSTQAESVLVGHGDGADFNGIACRVQLAFDHNFVSQMGFERGAIRVQDQGPSFMANAHLLAFFMQNLTQPA